MTTKKKIILTILLAVLVGVGVYCVVVNLIDIIDRINFLIAYKNEDFISRPLYIKYLVRWIIYLCFFIFATIIGGLLIFRLWFNKKTKAQLKYSYQDYKDEKHKKRLEKLDKKKKSIDNQINNLNK